jgi:hypothetical protein
MKISLLQNSVTPLQWNGNYFIMVHWFLTELHYVHVRDKVLSDGIVEDNLSQNFLCYVYWMQNIYEPELCHSKRGIEDGKGVGGGKDASWAIASPPSPYLSWLASECICNSQQSSKISCDKYKSNTKNWCPPPLQSSKCEKQFQCIQAHNFSNKLGQTGKTTSLYMF